MDTSPNGRISENILLRPALLDKFCPAHHQCHSTPEYDSMPRNYCWLLAQLIEASYSPFNHNAFHHLLYIAYFYGVLKRILCRERACSFGLKLNDVSVFYS